MKKKRTILAVDDTPANLIALEAVLDREFDLRYARSGAEAIASLQEKHEVGGIDDFTKPLDPDLLRLKMSVYSSFRHEAAISLGIELEASPSAVK